MLRSVAVAGGSIAGSLPPSTVARATFASATFLAIPQAMKKTGGPPTRVTRPFRLSGDACAYCCTGTSLKSTGLLSATLRA
ncbi:MAG: hypothetical protein V4789_29415, partial [Burkholderia gladioli]